MFVLRAFLLDEQHLKGRDVENKSASSPVVFLGKVVNGTRDELRGRGLWGL